MHLRVYKSHQRLVALVALLALIGQHAATLCSAANSSHKQRRADGSGRTPQAAVLARWQPLYAQVFESPQPATTTTTTTTSGGSNATAEQVIERLAQLYALLAEPEAPKSIPEEQRRNVKGWLIALQEDPTKCRNSFEMQLAQRADAHKGSNLHNVLVEHILKKLAHFCLHSTGLYEKLGSILGKHKQTIMSFVDDDGDDLLIDLEQEPTVNDSRVADYLAPFFDPLWPGNPIERDSKTFKHIYMREMSTICGQIVEPMQTSGLAIRFMLESKYLPSVDPEERVYEWNKMLQVCSYLQDNAMMIYREFPDAVTRYQFYKAPLKSKSQLIPFSRDSNERLWAHLYQQVFAAAPETIIKPMSSAQVVAAMKQMGSIVDKLSSSVPKTQKRVVKLWLELLVEPHPDSCGAEYDDWLRYHMSLGLPGVGSVPCNFKQYVEHVRLKHFEVCTSSSDYKALKEDVASIPLEDIELLKSIKPIGLYGGGLDMEDAAKHLAKFYEVKKIPFIWHGKNAKKFNKAYEDEISRRCNVLREIYFDYGDLIDYLMNRYFENRIERWLKDLWVAMSSCELVESGRKLLSSELKHAVRKRKCKQNLPFCAKTRAN